MQIKNWKLFWGCVALVLLILFALHYCIQSAPPNLFYKYTQSNDIDYIDVLILKVKYGEPTNCIANFQTKDANIIEDYLGVLKKQHFWYYGKDMNMGLGEDILLSIYLKNGKSTMLQLTKVKKQDGNDRINIAYEDNQYFIEYFSEMKELALYEQLYQLTVQQKQ